LFIDSALKLDPSFFLVRNSKAASFAAEGNKEEYENIKLYINIHAPKTPFINLRFEGDTLSKSAKERGTTTTYSNKTTGEISMGKAFKPISDWLPKISFTNNFSHQRETTARGGIFSPLREGNNLVVAKNGASVLVGTWFNFNYPLIIKQN